MWPRTYLSADYLPESQRNLTPEPTPVKAGLVLRYEVIKNGDEWECDCQIHGNPDPTDLDQAFLIVQGSASNHLSKPPAPVVQEVVTTEPIPTPSQEPGTPS